MSESEATPIDQAPRREPDRFSRLLEKIDPSVRLERLRKDRDQLQERLLEAVADVKLQEQLVIELESAEGPEAPLESELAEARRAAAGRVRVANAVAAAFEEVLGELEDANKIGTRAERRRRR